MRGPRLPARQSHNRNTTPPSMADQGYLHDVHKVKLLEMWQPMIGVFTHSQVLDHAHRKKKKAGDVANTQDKPRDRPQKNPIIKKRLPPNRPHLGFHLLKGLGRCRFVTGPHTYDVAPGTKKRHQALNGSISPGVCLTCIRKTVECLREVAVAHQKLPQSAPTLPWTSLCHAAVLFSTSPGTVGIIATNGLQQNPVRKSLGITFTTGYAQTVVRSS